MYVFKVKKMPQAIY